MKTYLINRTFNGDLRVTFEDDIQFNFYAHIDSDSGYVTFYKTVPMKSKNEEFDDYERSQAIAAFRGVQAIYQEGLDIQIKAWSEAERNEAHCYPVPYWKEVE